LEQSKSLADHNVVAFTIQVEAVTDKLKMFKLSLIRRHLTGDIGIHLSPTFINHIVNELEEYQLIMSYLKKKRQRFSMNVITICLGDGLLLDMHERSTMNEMETKKD